MNERIIRPNDTTIMVQSLEELFQEEENITTKMLAERMTKLGKKVISIQLAGYLAHSFGFCNIKMDKGNFCGRSFYLRDTELLAKVKADLPHIEATCLKNQSQPMDSNYSHSRTHNLSFPNEKYLGRFCR